MKAAQRSAANLILGCYIHIFETCLPEFSPTSR